MIQFVQNTFTDDRKMAVCNLSPEAYQGLEPAKLDTHLVVFQRAPSPCLH